MDVYQIFWIIWKYCYGWIAVVSLKEVLHLYDLLIPSSRGKVDHEDHKVTSVDPHDEHDMKERDTRVDVSLEG